MVIVSVNDRRKVGTLVQSSLKKDDVLRFYKSFIKDSLPRGVNSFSLVKIGGRLQVVKDDDVSDESDDYNSGYALGSSEAEKGSNLDVILSASINRSQDFKDGLIEAFAMHSEHAVAAGADSDKDESESTDEEPNEEPNDSEGKIDKNTMYPKDSVSFRKLIPNNFRVKSCEVFDSKKFKETSGIMLHVVMDNHNYMVEGVIDDPVDFSSGDLVSFSGDYPFGEGKVVETYPDGVLVENSDGDTIFVKSEDLNPYENS